MVCGSLRSCCFYYTKKGQNGLFSVDGRKPTHYVDMQGRQVDHDAMKMIEELCDKKIPGKLEVSNCKKYEVEWVGMAGYRYFLVVYYCSKMLNRLFCSCNE